MVQFSFIEITIRTELRERRLPATLSVGVLGHVVET